MSGDADGFEMKSTASISDILHTNAENRVTVMMYSGAQLSGEVSSVGEKLVHLSSGSTFDHAYVSIDRIGAVVID